MADYCTDAFKMVEDTDDSYRMWQGLVGPHYVPIMSNDGTLRWTNNGGLPNPQEVNLMGPQGAGIRIAGIRESAEELPATAPAGDIWLVGEGSPYEGYSFTGGEWIDLGPLTVGPAGPPGPQGDDYELTEADKQEIAEISESLLLAELDNDPLAIRYGGTGAHDLAEAKENLGIGDIENKLGTWPLGTDAQDVAGAINEMIGEIALQVADIEQLKDNFAGEFSPTSTYAVGAYVVYGGAFWRCTTAVTTAGSWTGASNWTQVTAGTELEALATTIDIVGDKVDALAASDIANDSAVSGAKVSDALTGLKTSLNNLGSDDVANDSSNVSGATVTAAIDSLKSSLATVPDFAPKTAIPQNSNLNDYRTAGTYYVQTDVIAATISNIPRNASGILIVINRGSNNVYCSQFYMPTTSMTLIYVRNYNSGSWTGWATISNSINEELTLTRTENDLQNDTDFARIKAYRRNGVLTLYLNSLFNANKTTSEFVEIGRISGWSAIGEVLQSTPAQSTTYSAITYHVSSDGIIKVLVAGTSLKAFYRAVITVPCS